MTKAPQPTLAEIGKAELALCAISLRTAIRIEEALHRLERLGCDLNEPELRLREIAAELRSLSGLDA